MVYVFAGQQTFEVAMTASPLSGFTCMLAANDSRLSGLQYRKYPLKRGWLFPVVVVFTAIVIDDSIFGSSRIDRRL